MAMKCDKVKNLLSAYLNRDIDERSRVLIDEHLAVCSECRKELEELKAMFQVLGQVKPVMNMPYPPDDFLPQVRRKIRTQAAITTKRGWLPRLIPAFSSAVMILVAVVLFNTYRNNQMYQSVVISEPVNEETTVAGYMDNLDEDTQSIVAEQMLNNISDTDLELFDGALIASLDADELLSNLNESEQEIFMNQILKQYQEAQGKVNPDWVEIDPGQNTPASFGG